MKFPARTTVLQTARSAFVAWDFAIGLAGGGLAFGLCWVKAVRDAVVPALLAEAAFGVAVTATVLAAMALLATFYDPAYRRVLDLAPGGFRSALEPYGIIGAVAAGGRRRRHAWRDCGPGARRGCVGARRRLSFAPVRLVASRHGLVDRRDHVPRNPPSGAHAGS